MIARMKIPFIVLTRSKAYKMSNNITLLYTAIYRLGDQKPIHWTFLAFKILQNNTPSLYKVLKACANFFKENTGVEKIEQFSQNVITFHLKFFILSYVLIEFQIVHIISHAFAALKKATIVV